MFPRLPLPSYLTSLYAALSLVLILAYTNSQAEAGNSKHQLTISVAFAFDIQAGQDQGTDMFFSVLTDEASSAVLKKRFGSKFTGVVVIENEAFVLKHLQIPARCRNKSISGGQLKVTVTSFSYPNPFDPDVNWLTAKAIKVLGPLSPAACNGG